MDISRGLLSRRIWQRGWSSSWVIARNILSSVKMPGKRPNSRRRLAQIRAAVRGSLSADFEMNQACILCNSPNTRTVEQIDYSALRGVISPVSESAWTFAWIRRSSRARRSYCSNAARVVCSTFLRVFREMKGFTKRSPGTLGTTTTPSGSFRWQSKSCKRWARCSRSDAGRESFCRAWRQDPRPRKTSWVSN